MDSLREYSSDDGNSDIDENENKTISGTNKLPLVPDCILNRFSQSQRSSKAHSKKKTFITSYIFSKISLDKEQRKILNHVIEPYRELQSLLYDSDLKIEKDLHISLSYNFKVRKEELSLLVQEIRNEWRREILPECNQEEPQQQQQQQHTAVMSALGGQVIKLASTSSSKWFLAVKIEENPGLNKLIQMVNRLVRKFDPSYLGGETVVHVSIAESETEFDLIDGEVLRLHPISFPIDNISITKGTEIEAIYL